MASLFKHTPLPKSSETCWNNICLGWIIKGANGLEQSATGPVLPPIFLSPPLYSVWFMGLRPLLWSFEKKMPSWHYSPLTYQMNHWPAYWPVGLLSLPLSLSLSWLSFFLSLSLPCHSVIWQGCFIERWLKPAPGTHLYFIPCSYPLPPHVCLSLLRWGLSAGKVQGFSFDLSGVSSGKHTELCT